MFLFAIFFHELRVPPPKQNGHIATVLSEAQDTSIHLRHSSESCEASRYHEHWDAQLTHKTKQTKRQQTPIQSRHQPKLTLQAPSIDMTARQPGAVNCYIFLWVTRPRSGFATLSIFQSLGQICWATFALEESYPSYHREGRQKFMYVACFFFWQMLHFWWSESFFFVATIWLSRCCPLPSSSMSCASQQKTNNGHIATVLPEAQDTYTQLHHSSGSCEASSETFIQSRHQSYQIL